MRELLKNHARFLSLAFISFFMVALLMVIWLKVLHEWIVYPVLFLITFPGHIYFKDSLAKIGFWPVKFFDERFAGILILLGYSGFLAWMTFGSVDPVTPFQAVMKIAGGSLWGLMQQYALNGFIVNRFSDFFGSSSNAKIPWLAASLFSLAHAPNWFLMAVTFVAGYASARIFLQDRNIYLLAVAHGIISFLLLSLVPWRITRGFRIGTHYFVNR